jgi:hypothetical protein
LICSEESANREKDFPLTRVSDCAAQRYRSDWGIEQNPRSSILTKDGRSFWTPNAAALVANGKVDSVPESGR